MSRKTELLSLFDGYKARFVADRKKVDEVTRSTQYTPEGKADQINKIVAEFAPVAQTYRDQAVALIDGGLQALQANRKRGSVERLTDAGYQAGLANALKMLEAGAYSQPEDVQALLDVYKGDFAALRMISKVLSNSENDALKDLAVQVPADNYEQGKTLLTRLQNSIREYFQADCLTKSPSLESPGAELGVDSMSNFVTDRLTNDLELNQ